MSAKGIYRRKTSAKLRRSIKARDGWCRYCVLGRAETVDHIIPYSRGGSSWAFNLVASCLECNRRKANRTPKEAGMILHLPPRFYQYRGEVRKIRDRRAGMSKTWAVGE